MVSITFPKSDIDALVRQMERAQVELGKSVKQSMQWAGVEVCGTLAGSCKVSPKKRRVVKNPHPDAKTDARRAKFGVMRYTMNGDGSQYFQPIYRTGEFGKIRFFDKKTMSVFEKDKTGGRWIKVQSGLGGDVANPEIVVPGIMNSKKRNIGRSGLAKLMWQRVKGYVIRGGHVSAKGVPDIAGVTWLGLGFGNTTLQIWSKLRYVEEAFIGGRQDVTTAMLRASDSLRFKINRSLAKIAAGGK